MDIKLSILIPSVPERMGFLSKLVEELHRQVGDKPAEILVLLDNKRRTTGSKRNTLTEMAKGEYVSFVDDDDWVLPEYVSAILEAIDRSPGVDCIVFDLATILNGIAEKKPRRIGIEFTVREDDNYRYGPPGYLMVYARRIVAKHKFPDWSYGEDGVWVGNAAKDIVRQERIPAVLYEYHWVPKPMEWYYNPYK